MAINNAGTASTYPVFTIIGPGRLYHIINETTGQEMHFALLLQDGETAVLDLKSIPKAFTSTFRGDIIASIIEGSDVATFQLAPGANSMNIFIDDAGQVFTQWDELHWSVDGGANGLS